MNKMHTLNELVDGAFPVKISKNRLKQLIFAGELHKAGTLREWLNYVIAANVGNGMQRARWAVSQSELDAWLERAKNSSRRKEVCDNLRKKWPSNG